MPVATTRSAAPPQSDRRWFLRRRCCAGARLARRQVPQTAPANTAAARKPQCFEIARTARAAGHLRSHFSPRPGPAAAIRQRGGFVLPRRPDVTEKDMVIPGERAGLSKARGVARDRRRRSAYSDRRGLPVRCSPAVSGARSPLFRLSRSAMKRPRRTPSRLPRVRAERRLDRSDPLPEGAAYDAWRRSVVARDRR